MSNTTILWIVIGVAVLLVIIAIIYAVTRSNSSDTTQRRPEGGRSGTGAQRRSQPSTGGRTDQRSDASGRREHVHGEDAQHEVDSRRQSGRKRRDPDERH